MTSASISIINSGAIYKVFRPTKPGHRVTNTRRLLDRDNETDYNGNWIMCQFTIPRAGTQYC